MGGGSELTDVFWIEITHRGLGGAEGGREGGGAEGE